MLLSPRSFIINLLRDTAGREPKLLNFYLNVELQAESKLSVKAAYSGHRGSVSFVLSIVREWPESFSSSSLAIFGLLPRLPRLDPFGYEPGCHA